MCFNMEQAYSFGFPSTHLLEQIREPLKIKKTAIYKIKNTAIYKM